MHDKPAGVLVDTFGEEEYWDVGWPGGQTDEPLARMTIRASAGAPRWMAARGVAFQPSLSGTLSLGRTNAFFRPAS
jgi:tricarballylate dehydrogenase